MDNNYDIDYGDINGIDNGKNNSIVHDDIVLLTYIVIRTIASIFNSLEQFSEF